MRPKNQLGTGRIEPDPALEVYKPPQKLANFRKLPGRDRSQRGLLTTLNLERIERRYQVVELRRIGYSMREIADAVGVSEVTVREDLRKVLEITVQQIHETVLEQRAIEAERLDDLQKAYYLVATQPLVDEGGAIIPENMQAAMLILKIMERRAKLLGLDKPEAKSEEKSAVREYVGIDMDQV